MDELSGPPSPRAHAQHLPDAGTNGPYASAMWNHGRRSSAKYCRLLGCSRAAWSNAPTWKCVSVGPGRLSHVNVDPHRAQNPRRVLPGVESNLVISPLVTVYAWQSNATKTATGAPVCLRQLWQ